MPIKIAKFGLCKLDPENILIVGGLLIQTAEQDKQEQIDEPSYCQI
jgi:hypothetical protein